MKINTDFLENNKLKENFVNSLTTDFLVFNINLVSFVQYFDLTENEDLIKFIVNKGQGVLFPSESDNINFKVVLRINNKVYEEKIFCNEAIKGLDCDEKLIFKSMKLNENSVIEFSPSLAFNLFNNESSLFYQLMKEVIDKGNNKNYFMNNRFLFIVTLTSIKEEKDKEIYLNDSKINKTTIIEGYGHICPWDNYLCFLLFEILDLENNQTVYSNYDKYKFTNDVLLSLKEDIISQTINDCDLQFTTDKVINSYLKQFNLKIIDLEEYFYDSYSLYLPLLITDYIKTMKIMECVELKYNGIIDYLKFDNIEIINQTGNFKFKLSLINFQENPYLFEEVTDEALRVKRITEFKDIANSFYSKNLIDKAEHINFNIINNLTGKLNLLKQGVKISFSLYNELQKVLSKIHSNLIMILFKKEKNLLCREYVVYFLSYYNKQIAIANGTYFKVNMISYQILCSLYDYLSAKDLILDLISVSTTDQKEYLDQKLKEINNLLNSQGEKKQTLIKKMFKYNQD